MKYPKDFDDKEELRDYVIEIIQKTGITPSLKNTHPKVYTFFMSLFQRHPEKDRKEIALVTDIAIRKFPKIKDKKKLDYSEYQFIIIKNNKNQDTISWNKCVEMSEYPIEKLVNWAMRYAVKDQIIDFKNANINKPCELCASYENITADHVIKFKNLKEGFLLENQEYPKEFDKNEIGSVIFRKEDIVFEKLWQEYHKKNATLRILCKNCNEKLDDYPTSKYNSRSTYRNKALEIKS